MSTVDDIKSRLDLLDIVSQYTQLQRAGRSYKALCPFHNEKTPSFIVFPERQTWRCFGACATGGDMFSFLMRIENMDFSESLKRLAQHAGVNIPKRREGPDGEDALYRLNEAASEHFRYLLSSVKSGANARAYLKGRGVTHDSIDRFELGLSPGGGGSLRDHLASKQYTQQQVALAGLVTQSQDGGYRDMFRRRLMFPIRDDQGRLAGFGARALDDSNPKYLNSPQSAIFDKGRILYALHLAKDAVADGGIVIVEGYMDALMAHQHGFSNVVASMGTALTTQQADLVRRLVRRSRSGAASKVVLALDPDEAGQEATLRSLESSWEVFHAKPVGHTRGPTIYERPDTPTLKVAPLPPGKDPDQIILESPEAWARLVEDAPPLIDHLFTALSARLDLDSPEGKARLAELIFPLIAATPDPFQQDHYFQLLAARLGVSEATLQASLGRPRPGRAPGRSRSIGSRQGGGGRPGQPAGPSQEVTASPFMMLEHDPLEEYCLALILQGSQLVGHDGMPAAEYSVQGGEESGSPEADGGLRLEYFRRPDNREVFTNLLECSTLELQSGALDEELKGHLDYLLAKKLPPADRIQRQADLKYCIRRLEERYLRELNREQEVRLSNASPEEREEQEERIIQVNARLNDIFRG